MNEQAMNVLVIQTDEHRPDAMRWAGHPFVETPSIDRLVDAGPVPHRRAALDCR